ncbi:MAG: hypothetical protein KKD01_09655 [Proteobacteria bacterium]|nr:hypothetical protein [Pseudomonadota bacterium]MBU1138722.1 hypothetical protein [Pseudomonadota bacterium]MBU1233592.1 hypothetical protein [Pseudomonadota bacterium]MBU1420591.1 hypothetical protein [Pseudomonadota bacterium]MBU1454976.1 hypothetical protein [Pseudomonadota bacterium]
MADVSLFGTHFDDLVSLFGFRASKNNSFALQGKMILSGEELQADFKKIQAGSQMLQRSLIIFSRYGVTV